SRNSRRFTPNSYHNGSIWPHDTSMIAEGMENFGFTSESQQVRQALTKALEFFQSPVELFVFSDEGYREYCSPSGQTACKKQAWSAASILAL
ncbi:MAG: amylo-alpha-1,6-glucosidase, partial [Candidatus Yanofskybacteria bacterium]|nr:amylo-alpha-1,6-glucosidase [Candidatus Yanofskybacteria bacterium]